MVNVSNEVEKIKDSVQDEIKKSIDSIFTETDHLCNQIIYYHFGWDQPGSRQGKMLRPVLVVLTCEAFGGKWQDAIPAAAAVELIHNFSLIHDDIEDNDAIRHGKPTVWKKFGIPQAINTGDALIGAAFSCLSNQLLPKKPAGRFENFLAVTIVNLTQGQSLDIANQSKASIGVDDYWLVVDKKTGSLLAESFRLGALAAGANVNILSDVYEYGLSVGRAFQIQDDILGIWGVTEETGKSIDSDLLQHKKTLPIILASNASHQFNQVFLKEVLDENDLNQLMRILNDLEIKKKTTDLMYEQLCHAKVKLNEFKLNYSNVILLDEMIEFFFSNSKRGDLWKK